MKHFLVEIIYKAPSEVIEAMRPEHRKFLQTGYQDGKLLLSGPKAAGDGGIVIARDKTEDDVVKYFKDDPYHTHGMADYRIVEFNPASHQPFLKEWL